MREMSGGIIRIPWILIMFGCLLLSIAGQATARDRVAVGGYLFPPFVNDPLSGDPGITFDVIKSLNAEQDRFEFHFVPTGANRRYYSFVNREFDVILFESPNWGWKQRGLQFGATDPFHFGGEVYITRLKNDRDQRWFDNVKKRSICGIFGYHYGFADFVSDSTVLERKYDIFLADRPNICLNMVLHGRADLSVVTRSWLTREIAQNPEIKGQLLVSSKLDQEYRHQAIVHPDAAVSVAQMNDWLQALRQRGDIEKMVSGGRILE